jgi:peptidylprolyl isomerase
MMHQPPSTPGEHGITVKRVVRGDRVQLLCASRLADGTWADHEVDPDAPLWLDAGACTRPQPISDAVIGMAVGESKTLVIPPLQGFGPLRPEMVFRVRPTALPSDVAIGDHVATEHAKISVRGIVRAIDDRSVTVDANHPLAGETLTVELQLLAIFERR